MTLRTVSPQASRVVSPTRAEVAHDLGHLLELHVVELDVLAGGDVAPAPRVGVGEVGHHVELLGRDAAVRDLHPHHLVVAALALAVDAVVQAEDAEDVLLDLAGEVLGEDRLELLGVGELCGIDLALTHVCCSDARRSNPERILTTELNRQSSWSSDRNPSGGVNIPQTGSFRREPAVAHRFRRRPWSLAPMQGQSRFRRRARPAMRRSVAHPGGCGEHQRFVVAVGRGRGPIVDLRGLGGGRSAGVGGWGRSSDGGPDGDGRARGPRRRRDWGRARPARTGASTSSAAGGGAGGIITSPDGRTR